MPSKSTLKVPPPAATTGRPKTFGDEPTERLNFMLPLSMVRWLRHRAIDTASTPTEILAACVAEAMAREVEKIKKP